MLQFYKSHDTNLKKKENKILILPLAMSLMLSACTDASKVSEPKSAIDEPDMSIVDTHSDDGVDKIGLSMPTQYLEHTCGEKIS